MSENDKNLASILACCLLLLLIRVTEGKMRAPNITEHPVNVLVSKNDPVMLSCKADGDPEPVIQWYKDGKLVERYRKKNNRILLPTGQLFFFKLVHGEKEQDSGVYWCVAKNAAGTARSQNASVQVAVFSNDFGVEPKDTRVLAGKTAFLECDPPRGYPEPVVEWKKNSRTLNLNDTRRFRIVDRGNLMINDVKPSDGGKYQCVAKNKVGSRLSRVAVLTVHVKPYFIKKPSNATALTGENVQLHCQVEGNPFPTISWRRLNGKMPTRKISIPDKKGIQIENLVPEDEGIYICDVENLVGTISAMVFLTVHLPAMFLRKPQDQKVSLNGNAIFDCEAKSNPPPSIFWTKEGSQAFMFPGNAYGRFHVTPENSLAVQNAQKKDSGFFICFAVSVAGSAAVRAFLQITSVPNILPPILNFGPTNQTLPCGSEASMVCQTSQNDVKIKWLKNGSSLDESKGRFHVKSSGTLLIEHLQPSDSGVYTCLASSENGETSWSGFLTVDRENSSSNIYRTPDTSTFPLPPTKPLVLNVTDSTVTLSWKESPDNRNNSLPIIGYRVEYFSSDLRTGWVGAGARITLNVLTVTNLTPETNYIFIVRTENSNGLSPPSPVSDQVRTLGTVLETTLPSELNRARMRLDTKVVELKHVDAISSTAVRLNWQILTAQEFVEGLYVGFRELSGESRKYNMFVVLTGRTTSYSVSSLKKYSKYEFFLVPFYKSIEGQPSRCQSVQTMEDVPSAPPENIQVGMLNNTSAYVHWSPPPHQHHNGVILGYKMEIKGNSSNTLIEMTLNASVTRIILKNITTNAIYQVRVAGFTRVGPGPYSKSQTLIMNHDFIHFHPSSAHPSGPSKSVVLEAWFHAVMVIIILFVVFTFGGLIYLRKRQSVTKESHHASIPVINKKNINQQNSLNKEEIFFFDRTWGRNRNDSDAKFLKHNMGWSTTNYQEVDRKNLSTFHPIIRKMETPYATTSISKIFIEMMSKRINSQLGDSGDPLKDMKTCSSRSDSCSKQRLSPG